MNKNLLRFLFLSFLFLTVSVSAQPELDTTFRSTGKGFIQYSASAATQDAVVQPDNKIVLLGGCVTLNLGNVHFCLIRLNVDGSFDTTFGAGQGNAGYVFTKLTGFIANRNTTTGIALQNDGKIVVTGSASSVTSQLALVRYNADGSLDSSFGTGGTVVAPVNGNDIATKLLIQPDGKIVVVGYNAASQFVTRYLTNGTRDTSFGTNGVATISFQGNPTSGLSIALQPDGKILTGGSTENGSADSFLVTRLNANGSLDTSFDGDGFKSIAYGANMFPERGIVALAVQSDGRILALGDTNFLYRFNPDGSFDTSFDNDGARPALLLNADAYDLVVTPSGKISVVGSPTIDTDFPNIFYRVARYLPNGSPDTNFSGDGFLDIDIQESLDGATAVALDSQGKLVIGGRSAFGSIRNAPWNTPLFSAARLLAQPSQNVGFSGRVTDFAGKPVANAYLTLTDNSGIIGYSRTNNFGYFRFANVPSSQTYTLSTYSKGLNYYDRRVLVDDEIANFLVVGGK